MKLRPALSALAAIAVASPALFAVPATPSASAATNEAANPSLPFEKYKLANGLEVVLHEDKRTPIVTVNLWYHVGSKDEPQGKNGFAHLFEHVMFQGSKHVPEDTYFRYLERAGATNINGTTNLDRTNYFETVPSNRLELALWLESDRMGFLLDHADQRTFDSQREVVKNERRQNYENAPYGLASQFIRATIFPPSHPYHLLTIGTPKDLDAASIDDVRAFFRTWYVPNDATLVVVGDFDKDKTKALVEKYFGPIPSGTLPARAPAPEPKLAGETRLDMVAGVELPRVYVSWPTPPLFTQADAELDVLANVLTNGKTSRLYKRLVYDDRIAQDVRAYQASSQLASVFEIVATAAPGHTTDELMKAIDDELAKVRATSVPADELVRAKTGIRSGTIFSLESGGARADILQTCNQTLGDPGCLERDLARYEKTTADDVRDAARKYLPPARVVTVVTPQKGAPMCGELKGTSVKP